MSSTFSSGTSGKDFQLGREFELTFIGFGLRFQSGDTGQTQFLLANGFLQSRLHDLVEDFLANLLAVTLTNHVQRNLARTKALQAHFATQLIEPVSDLGVDFFARNLNGSCAAPDPRSFPRIPAWFLLDRLSQ